MPAHSLSFKQCPLLGLGFKVFRVFRTLLFEKLDTSAQRTNLILFRILKVRAPLC